MEHYLIAPHGNVLVNRVLTDTEATEARAKAENLYALTLDEEQVKE